MSLANYIYYIISLNVEQFKNGILLNIKNWNNLTRWVSLIFFLNYLHNSQQSKNKIVLQIIKSNVLFTSVVPKPRATAHVWSAGRQHVTGSWALVGNLVWDTWCALRHFFFLVYYVCGPWSIFIKLEVHTAKKFGNRYSLHHTYHGHEP